MAVDKLVDSAQLDADLTSVANAIRTKGGTSADLAFPAGFVQAIGDISSGDGVTLDDYYANNVTTYVNTNLTSITKERYIAFGDNTDSITFQNLVSANIYAFMYCGAKHIYVPKLQTYGRYTFANCARLEKIALPSAQTSANENLDNLFNGCTSLTHIDFGPNTLGRLASSSSFNNCPLEVLVVRCATKVPVLGAIAAFNNTPFANGGAGGTIYIPEVMYNHLGDGTALDYKAATNWSTIDGYGTITWAKIEGSQYENYYVDGTPVT